MAECEVSRDRVWNDQYHCSGHSVWFRDTIHPCLCPAGEAEARLESALAELAMLREERRKSAAELVSLANEVHSGDPERSGWSARIRTVAHRLWFAPPGEKGE